ncbi:hypothetical protein EKO04_009993 [Ascochyta lentis]|uniref:Uncharacterized protein n=1 Tax=Ascochyta lentis TaxID=205686 RepID=A0A8H7ITW0_9PLEO|nr:hypothetical protein EKO04_009993 [Ascochyta lentis]
MARSILTWVRAAVVAALAQQVVAQTCYYPNGNAAPSTEKACSSAAGSACCPENWQCLDNGLCYYPPSGLHGRYSCTDKDWNSPGCASNLCTYNMTVSGGESITQCSNHNNQWCCNADATSVDCCQEEPEPRPFFNLQDGVAYATIGSKQASSNPTISTVTGLATSGASGSSPSQTSRAISSASVATSAAASSARPISTSATPVTSVATSIRSASGGSGPETIYITNVITPSATSNASGDGATSSGGSGTNIGLIVGCAVGIPLALALVGILIWMLRKRRQANAHPYKTTPDGGESPDISPAALAAAKKQEVYRHSRPGASEIDSNPVGPGRPTSTIPGKAELDSGAGFQPGTGVPFAPGTAFIGGGNGDRSTWGSSPPGYSPGQGQGPFANNHEGAVELDSSMVMPVINEKSEHQPEYQAYRPPANAVEMDAVTTPPDDVEKQLSK